jgi:hypothetical protein
MMARRDFVRTGAGGLTLAGALPLLAGCTSAAIGAHDKVRPGDDLAMLDTVLALEYEAAAAYDAILAGSLLAGDERALAAAFRADHGKHAEALAAIIRRRGGAAAPAKAPNSDRFAIGALTGREDALRFLLNFEEGLALAHLGAVPAFADKDLAKNSAGILGVESMHWAVLRRALGEAPVPMPIIG